MEQTAIFWSHLILNLKCFSFLMPFILSYAPVLFHLWDLQASLSPKRDAPLQSYLREPRLKPEQKARAEDELWFERLNTEVAG